MAEAENRANIDWVLSSGDREMMALDFDDPLKRVDLLYQMLWRWADFHLYIKSPAMENIEPPIVHEPERLPGSEEYEFVYPIHDYGFKLSTSKASEMFSAGMSMCKLYYTIEKMIAMLIDKLKSGGIDEETEVQVALAGHELAQRKAFEVIINLPYNVVADFDPGAWGESYLARVKLMSEKYGFPPEAPRHIYRQYLGSSSQGIKR